MTTVQTISPIRSPLILAAIEAEDAWHKDLPRQSGPFGDDTEEIIALCERKFPLKSYISEESVRSNRQKLYMSIHKLRQTKTGWIMDVRVQKKPSTLQ